MGERVDSITMGASSAMAKHEFDWHNHLGSYENMAEVQRILKTSVGEVDLDQLEKKEMKIFGLKFTRYGQFKEPQAPRTHDDNGLQAQHAAANPQNGPFNQQVFDDAVKLCGDPTALSKDGKDIIDYAEQSDNLDARIAAKSAMIHYKMQNPQTLSAEELQAEKDCGRDLGSLTESLRLDLKAQQIKQDPSMGQTQEQTREVAVEYER